MQYELHLSREYLHGGGGAGRGKVIGSSLDKVISGRRDSSSAFAKRWLRVFKLVELSWRFS